MSLDKAKRLMWLVILILSLSLTACLGETEAPSPALEQSELTGNPTGIESVEVEGSTIHLTIYSTGPEGMMCAQT